MVWCTNILDRWGHVEVAVLVLRVENRRQLQVLILASYCMLTEVILA